MNYQEALKWLEQVSKRGNCLGLDRMRYLMDELGNPQDELKFVHIAGTNGKGSVMAFLEQMLLDASVKVGRYLSPALFEYEEKIRSGGEQITKEEVAYYTEILRSAFAGLENRGLPLPTIFETETAMSFLFFRDRGCELVLLETGMGGEEDATNIIRTTVLSVFSSISEDHREYLGDTVEEIASVKSGIIKPGVPAVSDDQLPGVRETLLRKAGEKGSRLIFLSPEKISNVRYGLWQQSFDYDDVTGVRLHLPGVHQIRNCALALLAAKTLSNSGWRITEKNIINGAERTKWPGRMEVLSERPLVIADGAHNPDAAFCLRRSIDLYFPDKTIYYIFGVFSDKEYDKIIDIMGRRAEKIFVLQTPGNPRALPAKQLTAVLLEKGENAVCAEDIKPAIDMALKEAREEDVILLFGSLSWLGEAEKYLKYGRTERII